MTCSGQKMSSDTSSYSLFWRKWLYMLGSRPKVLEAASSQQRAVTTFLTTVRRLLLWQFLHFRNTHTRPVLFRLTFQSTHREKLFLSWARNLEPHVARIGSLVWNCLLARITCHIYHVYMNVWDTGGEVSYCPRVNSKPGHYCAKRVLVTEIRCNVRKNVRSRKICSKIFRVEKFVESFHLGRKIKFVEIHAWDKE